jgi:hypothetical protein
MDAGLRFANLSHARVELTIPRNLPSTQSSINASKLVCADKPLLWGSIFCLIFLEGDVNAIAEIITPAEVQANYILNVIAVSFGLGVVVFVCLATSGLDTSIAFF